MYIDIKGTGSLEQEVAAFWTHLLYLYFPTDRCAIRSESKPGRGGTGRTDLLVSYFYTVGRTIVLVVENKRRELEGQSAAWRNAVDQVTGYLLQIQEQQAKIHPSRKLHAAVAVGRYVRFYHLLPGESTLKDLPGTNQIESPYEVKDNEREVHEILCELVRTCQ